MARNTTSYKSNNKLELHKVFISISMILSVSLFFYFKTNVNKIMIRMTRSHDFSKYNLPRKFCYDENIIERSKTTFWIDPYFKWLDKEKK